MLLGGSFCVLPLEQTGTGSKLIVQAVARDVQSFSIAVGQTFLQLLEGGTKFWAHVAPPFLELANLFLPVCMSRSS